MSTAELSAAGGRDIGDDESRGAPETPEGEPVVADLAVNRCYFWEGDSLYQDSTICASVTLKPSIVRHSGTRYIETSKEFMQRYKLLNYNYNQQRISALKQSLR